MLKERREIVEDLRDGLHEAELAVEAALVAIGKLAISLPAARSAINISPVAGQPALDSIGAALMGIVHVRGHMVAAHGHLEATRGQFRLPIVGAGAGSEKPPSELHTQALHPVPNSAAA